MPENIFENLLSFADLQEAAREVVPLLLNDWTLDLLFYLRIAGFVLAVIFLLAALLFYFKVKKLRKPKPAKIGLSSLDKDSLLNEKNLKTIEKKIADYIAFDNILYWKLALAEADSLLGKVLAEIGFKGSDIYEKLCNAKNHIDIDLEVLKDAHIKVSDILDDNNYLLTRGETEQLIAIYHKAIEDLKKL